MAKLSVAPAILRQVRQKVQGQLRAAQVRHLFIDSLAVNTIYLYMVI